MLWGGSAGYECTESYTTLTEETVTTVGEGWADALLSYSSKIDASTIKVVFDGAEYECEADCGDWNCVYGATWDGNAQVYDWSTYPFRIISNEDNTQIMTETAGTYTLKIEALTENITTTECFAKAVKSITVRHILDGVADGSLRSSTALAEGESVEIDGEAVTYALGEGAFAEGTDTIASGYASHAEGGKDSEGDYGSFASGDYSHAEGKSTTASGVSSHAEGYFSEASGDYSHAEGTGTASGHGSHAEGGSVATGDNSHAEGRSTASGNSSHAEGEETTASGVSSHAEGFFTTASGDYSHAEGNTTTANHRSQHTFGEYNVEDSSTAGASARGTYVEIVGNGTGFNARSNARTLDWSGNEALAGSLTLGKGTANEVTITATQLTQLLALLNS